MPLGPYNGPEESTANGVTTVFPYTFKIFDVSHLGVSLDDELQVSGYTVSGVGDDSGGNVTFAVAPANGVIVKRASAVPYVREVDYQRNGAFDEETVETDQDIQERQIQQLAVQITEILEEIEDLRNLIEDLITLINELIGGGIGDTIILNSLTINELLNVLGDAIFEGDVTFEGDVVFNGTVDLPDGSVNINHLHQDLIDFITNIGISPNSGVAAAGYRIQSTRLSATSVQSQAIAFTLKDAENNTLVLYDVDETADITVSGLGGLDTGAEANDTWYYHYIIAKEDGTQGSVLSANFTAPTLPADYIYYALISAVRNNGSGNFIAYDQVGMVSSYRNAQRIIDVTQVNGNDIPETEVSVAAAVPPIAVNWTATGFGAIGFDAEEDTSESFIFSAIEADVFIQYFLTGHTNANDNFFFIIPNTQAFFYTVENTQNPSNVNSIIFAVDIGNFRLTGGGE